jgi:hypothetical protein
MSETTPISTPLVTPTPNEAVSIINNCDTVTLFDIGLRCNVERPPSTSTSTDGILSIIVTGGTSPYTVYWNGIQGNQRLIGIGQGSYPVTVVDYYGDYTASTVCSLTVPTATPIPTATPTPTPTPISYPNLCFISQEPNISYGPIQFIWNGNSANFNGKPTWSGTYNSTPLTVRWVTQNQLSRWEIQGWNFTAGIPVSTNTTNIPNSAWSMAGGQPADITMEARTCPPFLPLRTSITKQDSTCPNSNNGSIIISAIDGISGYSYSINGGVTYTTNNIFTNQAPNTYTVVVKDSATPTPNTTTTQISIVNLNQITNYTFSVQSTNQYSTGTGNKTFEWELKIIPPLLTGKSINLYIQTQSNNYLYQPGNGTFTNTYEIKKNGIVIPPDIPSARTFGGSVTRVGCSSQNTIYSADNAYYLFTISQGDVITGTTTSSLVITNNQTVTNCATKLETESSVQLISVLSTTGFTVCDKTILTGLGGLRNILP